VEKISTAVSGTPLSRRSDRPMMAWGASGAECRRRRAWIAAAWLLAARPAPAAPVTEVHYTMGTYLSITLDGLPEPEARTLMRRCFAEAQRLESIFSRFDPASELSRINAGGGARTLEVSTDMVDLLRRGLALHRATGGTFDVTIGALTRLWREAAHWPSAADLRRAGAGAAGERARVIDEGHIALAPGVLLDFDGFAKGYAVDRCVTLLRGGGATAALISLGESSQYALGAPAGENGWPVTLRDLDADRAIGTLRLRDQAISVSSVFGHEHTIGGRHVGHIVDPRSGRPLTEPAMAVVVAPSATDAEAFSKAFLIAPEPGPVMVGAGDALSGAMIVGPGGARQVGEMAFTPFTAAAPIAAEAEPLR
jgi:thiamine biosynthesis lipoprotein